MNYSTNEEVWKDIEGYEGLYQVSGFGIIRSLDRVINMKDGRKRNVKGKELKPTKQNTGRLFVTLYKDGHKEKRVQIHRMVGEAFIDNPLSKPQINHIDGVATNNNVKNLEWVSCQENMDHAWEHKLYIGRKGEKSAVSKLSEKDIFSIRKLFEKGVKQKK